MSLSLSSPQVVSLLLRSGQFSASYLQRSDMPHTALVLAAKQGHNECIGLLVKHGFDVNRKLPGGNSGTALHEAALNGRVDTVRYLLQARALEWPSCHWLYSLQCLVRQCVDRLLWAVSSVQEYIVVNGGKWC